MSRFDASMVNRLDSNGIVTNRFAWAGLMVAMGSSQLHAQVNFFREPSVESSPTVAIQVPSSATEIDSLRVKRDPADVSKSDSPSKTADDVSEREDAEREDMERKDAERKDAEKSKSLASSRPKKLIILPALTIPNTTISDVGTGALPEDLVSGRFPSTIPLPYGPDRYGFWSLSQKTWLAPTFCHQPLYFEDVMLERHGQERFPCIQSMLSGARFFSDVVFMPYHAYLQRPLEERYNTGHYRPGSTAPGLRQRAPYDAGALRFQLLTTGTTILAGQP